MSESKYTAEDLRKVLLFVTDEMETEERLEVFGVSGCCEYAYILRTMTADEIIEKVREVRNSPKVGDIFESLDKEPKRIVCIVTFISSKGPIFALRLDDDNTLCKYYWSKDYFTHHFRKVGHSKHMDGIRDELLGFCN